MVHGSSSSWGPCPARDHTSWADVRAGAGPALEATIAPLKRPGCGPRHGKAPCPTPPPTPRPPALRPRGWQLPAGFRFGVATAGFQVEGGFNGSGQPANNWWPWELAGRVVPSGPAVGFWARPEEALDRAAALGCDSFRLSLEWARVVPADGVVDRAALDRYRSIVTACVDRGLEPLVTLHHFTHPAWLGEDFWLRPDAPERFTAWADLAVEALADLVRCWVTINEINVLAVGSWLLGMFPPGGRWPSGTSTRRSTTC